MRETASITWALLDKAAPALVHKVSWTAACWVGAMVVITEIFRLLAEWQRRVTLVAIVQHAPGGTVIVQQRGRGGPAMWLKVGCNSPQPEARQSEITKPGSG